MSPNVSSFVGDLVEMARAFEELPQVRAALEKSEEEGRNLHDAIMAREESILRLKAEIETLQQRNRSLEVERDEAQFQALEEQERTTSFKRFVETMFGQAGNLLNAAKPVEPEPVAPQSEHSIDPGPAFHGDASNVDSVSSGPQPGESASGEQESSNPVPTALSQSPAETSDHTASADASEVASPSDPTPAMASSSESALPDWKQPGQPNPEPYRGKRYSEVPYFVTYANWIAGGGTEADYNR